MSTGSFYNHFESKAQLLEVAMAELISELLEALERSSDETEGPVVTLGAYLRTLAGLGMSHPEVALVALTEGFGFVEHAAVLEYLRKPVLAGMENGSFEVCDPCVAVDQVWAVTLTILRAWQRDPASTAQPWVDSVVCHAISALVVSGSGVVSI
ncbi:TetR/AcrR family transcriptional regulator [Nocardia heshunensis]